MATTISNSGGPGSPTGLSPVTIAVRDKVIEKFQDEPLDAMNESLKMLLSKEQDEQKRLGILRHAYIYCGNALPPSPIRRPTWLSPPSPHLKIPTRLIKSNTRLVTTPARVDTSQDPRRLRGQWGEVPENSDHRRKVNRRAAADRQRQCRTDGRTTRSIGRRRRARKRRRTTMMTEPPRCKLNSMHHPPTRKTGPWNRPPMPTNDATDDPVTANRRRERSCCRSRSGRPRYRTRQAEAETNDLG